jgi:hypothetical protein
MIPALRESFNRNFSPEKYRAFLAALDQACGSPVKFRVCETPCFFPRALLERLAAAGRALLRQITSDAVYLAAARQAIPAAFRVPSETSHPLFVQADFGLIRGPGGELEPRLVEIQGFPSLYAYQFFLSQTYIRSYALDPGLCFLLDFSGEQAYLDALRSAIVGGYDPENVVLLEIEPWEQKTLPDFTATEKLLGVRPVCITEVRKEGRRVSYLRDGKMVPIHRIYNRVIVDELQRKNIPLPFSFADDLDVEWAGHPNWFFLLSKFSLPHLKHPCVPRSWFLDRLGEIPADLENYVLKPLYSFAGLGVIVGPTRADLDAISRERRHDYLLQERMRFEPVIRTPHGPTQAEIRVMFLWPEGRPDPQAGPCIVRMGRGKMMGVDHNRELEWVGASAVLFPS